MIPAFWNGEGIPWGNDMKWKKSQLPKNVLPRLDPEFCHNVVAPGTVILVVRSGILRHTIPIASHKNEVALNQDMISYSSRYQAE
jgi:type I restriction enzyme, S subunit